MALLGYQFHVIGPNTVASNTGSVAPYAAYAAYAHSVATTPDLVIPQLRSVAIVGNGNAMAAPMLALGGNASQATVGYAMASQLSQAIFAFDLYVAYIHSASR